MTELSRTYVCDSLEATKRLAEGLAGCLEVPMAIRLDGTLGAGKTQFTKYFAQALGAAPEDVTSPTFVLVHRYATTPTMYHLDAYRVDDEDEFLELGVEEFFEEPVVSVVEWGEKFEGLFPRDHLAIEMEVLSDTSRSIRLIAKGHRSAAMLQKLDELKG